MRSGKISIKIIIKTIAFMIGLSLLYRKYELLVTDDFSSYSRVMFHELYEDLDQTQILLAGASLCYRGGTPQTFEDVLGKATFNIGTSAQSFAARYYLLESLLNQSNRIEKILLII